MRLKPHAIAAGFLGRRSQIADGVGVPDGDLPRRAAGCFAPSKYPPAKPGALEHWPLKAAGGVADAAPEL
jgi:hypothetical protein